MARTWLRLLFGWTSPFLRPVLRLAGLCHPLGRAAATFGACSQADSLQRQDSLSQAIPFFSKFHKYLVYVHDCTRVAKLVTGWTKRPTDQRNHPGRETLGVFERHFECKVFVGRGAAAPADRPGDRQACAPAATWHRTGLSVRHRQECLRYIVSAGRRARTPSGAQ